MATPPVPAATLINTLQNAVPGSTAQDAAADNVINVLPNLNAVDSDLAISQLTIYGQRIPAGIRLRNILTALLQKAYDMISGLTLMTIAAFLRRLSTDLPRGTATFDLIIAGMKQMITQIAPGPLHDSLLRALVQEIQAMPDGNIRQDNIQAVIDEDIRVPIGPTLTMIENLLLAEAIPPLQFSLDTIMYHLSGIADRYSRTIPPTQAPRNVIHAMCHELHNPLVQGGTPRLIINALIGQANVYSQAVPPAIADVLMIPILCQAYPGNAILGPTSQAIVQALVGMTNVYYQAAPQAYAPMTIIQILCQAYQGNAVPGPTLGTIVVALARQADVYSNQRTHAPNNIMQLLQHEVSVYPVGNRRSRMIMALINQCEIKCPNYRAIVDSLRRLVRQGHPPGPPINILQGRNLALYGNTGRILMNEYYRALDGQGLQNPPPTAAAAGGQWRYVGPVYQPDNGNAYLYTYVDGGGRIRDRLVQRNLALSNRRWNQVSRWQNLAVNTLPVDVSIMRTVNSRFVLRNRHIVLDVPLHIKREYIDYVEYGSLEGMISRHRQVGVKAFDESFLWYLFRSLTWGLLAMNTDMQAAPGALTGVLGNLHCGKVLLGHPNDISFRIYPVPKIAPFDAVATWPGDHDNRRLFINYEYKQEFAPPELERLNPLPRIPAQNGVAHPNYFVHFGANGAIKALSAANVYQVGVIMVCAMRLQTTPHPLVNPALGRINIDDVDPLQALVHGHSTQNYTAGLKNLVHSCLQHIPAARPTPAVLIQQIHVTGAAYFGGGALSLENVGAYPARRPTNHARRLNISMADNYRNGMSIRRNPARPAIRR